MSALTKDWWYILKWLFTQGLVFLDNQDNQNKICYKKIIIHQKETTEIWGCKDYSDQRPVEEGSGIFSIV